MAEKLQDGQPDEHMPLETVANVPAPSAAPGAPGDNVSFDGLHLAPTLYPAADPGGRTEAGGIQRELWNGLPDDQDYSTKWYGMGADTSPDETENG